MEMEYHDDSRKGRLIIIVGVILAIAAAGGAYLLVNQAQQQAEVVESPKVTVVVAARTIPSRKAIEAEDLAIASIPAELAVEGVATDPNELINRVPAVTILAGQVVSKNLLASSDVGGQFSILKPEETVAPDSPYWRAVAITVPDERAVAGLVQAGSTVDVILTAQITIIDPTLAAGATPAPGSTPSPYQTERSTKVTYQNVEILSRVGAAYVIRVPLAVAEEIEHLQAAGTVLFSLVLRPNEDTRIADASGLGATTNLVIQRYALPIPLILPLDGQPYTGSASAFPIPTLAPAASPAASPSPSAAP